MRARMFGLAVCLAAVACIARAASAATAPPFALPATFSGTTPCADCPGIRNTLTLGADGGYVLELHYLERHVPDVVFRGTWKFDAAHSRIVLRPPQGAPQYLALAGTRALRMLDSSGHEIGANANETLSLLTLASNTWVLAELRGQPLAASAAAHPPTLRFDAAHHRVTGSTGCNHLSGGYTISGDDLRFSRVMTTLMACADGMSVEAAFNRALDHARKFTFEHGMLNLYGGGQLLARFKATPKT